MALGELGERFSKVSTRDKYIGLVGVLILIGALFYFMFYSDLADKASRLKKQEVQLKQEKANYLDKQQRYNAFRAGVKKLLRKKKDLLKALPVTAEIPAFMQSLHAQAELSGLNIMMIRNQPEISHGFYAEIPVQMEIEGAFHQITKFFYSVGTLKRIVAIKDLLLKKKSVKDASGKMQILLTARFVASTYRFVESAPAPGPGKRG